MKHLLLDNIMPIQKNNKILLVIPLDRREEGEPVKLKRKAIKDSIKYYVSSNISFMKRLLVEEPPSLLPSTHGQP